MDFLPAYLKSFKVSVRLIYSRISCAYRNNVAINMRYSPLFHEILLILTEQLQEMLLFTQGARRRHLCTLDTFLIRIFNCFFGGWGWCLPPIQHYLRHFEPVG